MIEVLKIREQLKALIENRIALDDFEDWIVGESWSMHSDSDAVAQSLVSAIELRLAEFSSGHLPADKLLMEFQSLVSGFHVINVRLNADPPLQKSGASISLVPYQVPVQPAEIPPLRVYA